MLSQGDLASITLVSGSLIGLDIDYFQKTEHCLLPYRGSIQDLGPTITHKVEAIRLFEAGHLVPEMCELLSPVHSLQAVENYVQSYKNVLKLLSRQVFPLEISSIISISRRLVVAYVEIACEHHPDIVDQNPYLPLTENDDS